MTDIPQLSDSDSECSDLVFYIDYGEKVEEEPPDTSVDVELKGSDLSNVHDLRKDKEGFWCTSQTVDPIADNFSPAPDPKIESPVKSNYPYTSPPPLESPKVKPKKKQNTSKPPTCYRRLSPIPDHPKLSIDEPSSSLDPFSDLKKSISGMESFVSNLHRRSLTFDSPMASTPPAKRLELPNLNSRKKRKRNSIIKSVSHRPKIWKDEREFKRLTKEHTQKNTDSPLVYENHAHRVKRRRLSEVKFSPDIQDRNWQKFGTPVQAPTRMSDIKIKTYSIPSPVSPFVPKYPSLLKKEDCSTRE